MIFGGKKKKIEKLDREGKALFEAGDYANAVKRFALLCDLEPNSERLYYMGVLLDMMGIQDEAEKALRQSVDMDADNSYSWFSLAMICFGQSNFEGAHDAISNAYKADPNDFRILNLFAQVLIMSPYEDHKDPKRAHELAERACEITEYTDEVCMQTLEMAKENLGDSDAGDTVRQAADQHDPAKLTFEIIAHFEKRFRRKANDLALRNIVPNHVPVAVQTIESSTNSIVFTTGMSAQPMPLNNQRAIEFGELFMVIPGDHKMPNPVDQSIWPWHHLQQLAFRPHNDDATYGRDPQVVRMSEKSTLAEDVEFAAYLLLPNVKGYVDPLETEAKKRVQFILAMPIYQEEFELASQPKGIAKLFELIRASKTKPHYAPGRKNLAIH